MSINPRTTPLLAPAGTDASFRAYENWRERFVRPMLLGALAFGLVALILALTTNQGVVQNAVFILSYLVLMCVTFLQFPYWVRIGAFLLIVYALRLKRVDIHRHPWRQRVLLPGAGDVRHADVLAALRWNCDGP